jgi:hypothetical protein
MCVCIYYPYFLCIYYLNLLCIYYPNRKTDIHATLSLRCFYIQSIKERKERRTHFVDGRTQFSQILFRFRHCVRRSLPLVFTLHYRDQSNFQ